jgi:2-hydroxychromene-2-carboxylate isomerase
MANPRCYFSLRSPYSWLAHREMGARYPGVGDRLEWVPFWEPDQQSGAMLAELGGTFPYTVMSRAKHLYVLQDVGRIARQWGLTVRWPVDRDPVWEVPHLAYLVAARHGRGPRYLDATYRARWEEGRDICDRATVRAIGGEIGLDGEELAAAADDPVLRRRGAELLLQGCHDGVFGVPFFVHRYHRFWGLDRLPPFVRYLGGGEQPATPLPEPAAAAVGPGTGSDGGHAGGCG